MNDILRYVAVAGNVVFILWIAFNAIDSGFKGTIYEVVSGMGLIFLLWINIILITKNRPRN